VRLQNRRLAIYVMRLLLKFVKAITPVLLIHPLHLPCHHLHLHLPLHLHLRRHRLLHQRATALRSVLMGCRLSHMEMVIGAQAHCKANVVFYRQSTASPVKRWHLEFFPQSVMTTALPKSFPLFYEILENGAGHWRYIDELDASDLVFDADYHPVTIPSPARPPAKQAPFPLGHEKGKAEDGKSEDDTKNEAEKPTEVKTNEGSFMATGGVAISVAAREGTMSYHSLETASSGARFTIFSSCPLLVDPRQRPGRVKKGSPQSKQHGSSGSDKRTIIGLLVVPPAKAKGAGSLQIWTVPDGARLIRALPSDAKAEGGGLSSSEPMFVPAATRLQWAKINHGLLAELSKSAPVVLPPERTAELTKMRKSWLATLATKIAVKPGSFTSLLSWCALLLYCVQKRKTTARGRKDSERQASENRVLLRCTRYLC